MQRLKLCGARNVGPEPPLVNCEIPSVQVEGSRSNAAIEMPLKNLRTFPGIRERVENGTLQLHGWYFDIDQGALLHYNPDSAQFEALH